MSSIGDKVSTNLDEVPILDIWPEQTLVKICSDLRTKERPGPGCEVW